VSIGDTLAQVYFRASSMWHSRFHLLPRHKPMSTELTPQPNSVQPVIYQIRVKGHLDRQWTHQFEGLIITQEEDGNTLISGPVADQAALHGLLKKVRDLGMPLVSVSQVQPDETHSYRSNKEKK
jgi:hypothetical protein